MVDCAVAYGNYGCSGGWIYKYVDFLKADGACEYDSYAPYTATDGNCVTAAEADVVGRV